LHFIKIPYYENQYHKMKYSLLRIGLLPRMTHESRLGIRLARQVGSQSARPGWQAGSVRSYLDIEH
jgi:hypothetical protein